MHCSMASINWRLVITNQHISVCFCLSWCGMCWMWGWWQVEGLSSPAGVYFGGGDWGRLARNAYYGVPLLFIGVPDMTGKSTLGLVHSLPTPIPHATPYPIPSFRKKITKKETFKDNPHLIDTLLLNDKSKGKESRFAVFFFSENLMNMHLRRIRRFQKAAII